jgi:DNA-binding MarR family transcriptional regulator
VQRKVGRPARPEVVSAAQQALRGLVRVNGLIRGLAETHFATYGLSMAQWGVLRTLWRIEQRGQRAPRLHELGAEMIVRPPSLSATVDRMARAGLIARAEDHSDRRAMLILLAPAGRRLLDRRMPDHRMWVEGLMAGLNRTEQAALSRLLTKASEHMHGLAPAPRPGQAPEATTNSEDRA